MVSTEAKIGISNKAIGQCPTEGCHSFVFRESHNLLLLKAPDRESIAGGPGRYTDWPYMGRVYVCGDCSHDFVIDDGELIDVSEHLP